MRKGKPGSFYFFKVREIPDTSRWQLLRSLGKDNLSLKAQLKLEWIIFYHTVAKRNANLNLTGHLRQLRKVF